MVNGTVQQNYNALIYEVKNERRMSAISTTLGMPHIGHVTETATLCECVGGWQMVWSIDITESKSGAVRVKLCKYIKCSHNVVAWRGTMPRLRFTGNLVEKVRIELRC